MTTSSYMKKRPCRVCKKFVPNQRVGSRRKTCGTKRLQTIQNKESSLENHLLNGPNPAKQVT